MYLLRSNASELAINHQMGENQFFYDDLNNCKKLYEYDRGCESEEEQQKVHLFEVDVEDTVPQRRDMNIYDEVYNTMSETQDVQMVLACARRYFAGEQTTESIWEIMSDKSAKAVKDISNYVRNEKRSDK